MTGDSESNARAWANGAKGEDEAMQLMRKHTQDRAIIRVNGLIDFIAGGKWIEVKTCQIQTIDQTRPSHFRTGRFVLDIEQHEALIRRDGYYMFIVLKDAALIKHKMIRASEIKFVNNLTWTKVIY